MRRRRRRCCVIVVDTDDEEEPDDTPIVPEKCFRCDVFVKEYKQCQACSFLEEMRVASKSKKVEPILTTEERSSKVNKAEIKGTGFQMKMVQSLKGATMIEA